MDKRETMDANGPSDRINLADQWLRDQTQQIT